MTSSVWTDEPTSAAARQSIQGVLLEPLDLLFFRDGRPFGAATRGETQPMAWPQTLAGAVWTALLERHGCDFSELAGRVRERRQAFAEALDGLGLPSWIARVGVRGPWLARVNARDPVSSPPELLVPVPAVLHCPQKDGRGEKSLLSSDRPEPLIRLHPLPPDHSPPGWNRTRTGQQHDLRPLWLSTNQPTERVAGWMNLETLGRFLHGEALTESDILTAQQGHQLFGFDHRTGIGIDPRRLTAKESLIYAASFLALRRFDDQGRQVVLYAEVVWPEDAAADGLDQIRTMPFGGEGRRVALRRLPHPVSWPTAPPQDGQNTMLVLTTPGLFAAGWKPAALTDRLVAAAVPGSLAVSGWDLARGGPKPTRFAVPAGSVYFCQGTLESLPMPLADQPADRQQGWGDYVVGRWSDP